MVTMKMVAELAGVSAATVSRVLNSHPSCTPETVEKVMDTITSLDYKPNSIAKSLRRQKAYSFITIMNDIQNPVFANMIRGIEDEAYKNNYSLIIGNTDNSTKRESEYLKAFLTRKVDGMILITPHVKIEEIVALAKTMPIVLINDPREQTVVPSIGIDDYAAVGELVQHVLAAGHRKIAYIQGDSDTGIAQRRRQGFADCMTQNGISKPLIVEGGASMSHGASAMKKILETGYKPTCVIGYNDSIATGAIKQARAMGLDPCRDISFAGFDDTLLARSVFPALTTVYYPTYDIGRIAANMLLTMINGDRESVKNVKMHYRLLIRESVINI